MNYSAVIPSPVGRLGIISLDHHLMHIHFVPKSCHYLSPQTEVAHVATQQLFAYFTHPADAFDLPLSLSSVSEFQQQVCKALQRIPIGNTLTYRELADRLKTSARAIGQACRRNPFPIVIPCHRIVAQQGLGGYHGASQGPMATVKRWLLRHEQNALKRPTNPPTPDQ
ncbi:MAG: hypothetical protein A3F41_02200 [Coxiella sp. RIFCSPHIGHO2_12_FULL_44_14]|nr:MAG: hypothetical protein A3F41_02200 [Coxiella sp. RIFCSPHIGHO2_12_FULL_44_14]